MAAAAASCTTLRKIFTMLDTGSLETRNARGASHGWLVIASSLVLAGIWGMPSAAVATLVPEVIAESSMGDGELATAVPIHGVHALAAGPHGEIYLIDRQGWLREIGADGRIRTVARGPVSAACPASHA